MVTERQMEMAKLIVEGNLQYTLQKESEALIDWMLRVFSLELKNRFTRSIDFKLEYKEFYKGVVICSESINNYVHEFQTPFKNEDDLKCLMESAKEGINQLSGFYANNIESKRNAALAVLEITIER